MAAMMRTKLDRFQSVGFNRLPVISIILISLTVLTSGRNQDRIEPRAGQANANVARSFTSNVSRELASKRRQDLPSSNETPKDLDNRSFGFPDDSDDYRVPFWNIAHMINSIQSIEPALGNGSNGIEVDISFDSDGRPVESYHGFPCDCGRHCFEREQLVNLVRHVAYISIPPARSPLQLIVFDLKLAGMNDQQKANGGRQLAMILDQNLYRPYVEAKRQLGYPPDSIEVLPPIRVVVSINHVQDNVLVRSFLDYMRQNRLEFMARQVGFDVGMNDNLTDIAQMWDNLRGGTYNIWQGDGLTNCANIIRGTERLKQAISIRNSRGHFRKVYYWTADVMYHIRAVLRYGLDAVLTNQPQRVIQVLQEPEFKDKYRLATHYDDPFAQFWIKPLAWKMPVPTIREAIETVTNVRETFENFVKTMPNGIQAAFNKVQKTITSLKP